MSKIKFKNESGSVPNGIRSISVYSWNGWEITHHKGTGNNWGGYGGDWFAEKGGRRIHAHRRADLEDKLIDAENEISSRRTIHDDHPGL